MKTETNPNGFDKELKKYWNKLKSFKPEFDKIKSKNYAEALTFWEMNVMPHLATHPIKTMVNSFGTTFDFSENQPNQISEKKEDILTIYPASDEERKLFNEWNIRIHENNYEGSYEYNLGQRKEKFNGTIVKKKSLASQKRFIEEELKNVTPPSVTSVNNIQQVFIERAVSYGGMISFNSAIKQYRKDKTLPDFGKMDSDSALNFWRLKCNEDYREFLELQLEQIEKGNIIEKTTKDKEIEKLLTSSTDRKRMLAKLEELTSSGNINSKRIALQIYIECIKDHIQYLQKRYENETDIIQKGYNAEYLRECKEETLPPLEKKLKEYSLEKEGNELPVQNITKNLSWENKTKLCELIYSLCKSKRILENGQPISEKNLITIFATLFNVNLGRYYNLLATGMNTNEKTLDEKFFMKELAEISRAWKPRKKDK